MNRSTIILVQIVSLFVIVAMAGARPETDAEIAKRFHIRWSHIQYSKVLVVHNPEVSSRKEEPLETISLSCDVEVRDPNLVIGITPDCVVTRITDGQDRAVDVPPPSRRMEHRYEGLKYRPQITQGKKPARWKSTVRSLLRLSPDTNPAFRLVSELVPSRFYIRLPYNIIEQEVAEIGRIKGHVHALMAESYTYVDVPFEKKDDWVPLIPGLEMRVAEAECDTSRFRYRIEARPKGGLQRGMIKVGDTLPERMVVERCLLDADGEPIEPDRSTHLPFPIGGQGSGSLSNVEIRTIRYIIGEHPKHVEVPFEFEHVPLPQPETPSKTQDGASK